MSEQTALTANLALLPVTAAVDARGRLQIGGCDVVDLAHEFGTPLYLFDEATLRSQCRAHLRAFSSRYPHVQVLYAGKAYLGVRMAQLVRDEGLGLDVVSGGEMHIARVAGFPAQRVCLHGNNKPADELAQALEWGAGRIVVDNLHELEMLAHMAAARGVQASTLLRLAPAVDPHTHRYVATGLADSKFGLPLASGMAAEAVGRALLLPGIKLLGYHVHLGSQIRDLAVYRDTCSVIVQFALEMQRRHDFAPAEVSLGGGWAVPYLADDAAPSIDEAAEAICGALQSACAGRLPLPDLVVEPGRAIVARAGVALYRAGAVKDVAGVRRFVFVDGGMADNIRPALYGARYTALLANRMREPAVMKATIAGRYCESGDILVEDARLPDVQPGDVLAVAAAGAYAPAMASNYNGALRPAIVAVHEGKPTLWRRRETYEDLVAREA